MMALQSSDSEEMRQMRQGLAEMNLSLPIQPSDRLFPLKQGVELFIDLPDTELIKDIRFTFDIAFGEPGVAEGEHLLETIKAFSDLVNSLISDFDPLLA